MRYEELWWSAPTRVPWKVLQRPTSDPPQLNGTLVKCWREEKKFEFCESKFFSALFVCEAKIFIFIKAGAAARRAILHFLFQLTFWVHTKTTSGAILLSLHQHSVRLSLDKNINTGVAANVGHVRRLREGWKMGRGNCVWGFRDHEWLHAIRILKIRGFPASHLGLKASFTLSSAFLPASIKYFAVLSLATWSFNTRANPRRMPTIRCENDFAYIVSIPRLFFASFFRAAISRLPKKLVNGYRQQQQQPSHHWITVKCNDFHLLEHSASF